RRRRQRDVLGTWLRHRGAGAGTRGGLEASRRAADDGQHRGAHVDQVHVEGSSDPVGPSPQDRDGTAWSRGPRRADRTQMIDEAGCPKVLAVSPHPTAAHVARRQPGYFVLSFDTELAWGYFDK